MTIEKIIILEGDSILRSNLENYLRRCRYDVASTSTIAVAREYLSRDNFDIVFSELRLPDGDGAELLKEIQARAQKPLVVITTSSGSIESAVDCIKNGAFDYLIKPFSDEQIGITLRKAEEFTQLVRVNRLLSQETEESEHVLLGESADMENLRQLIRKVARTHATVLIQGESGTGKEAVARALYRESPRARAPFIKVNCAAIPENLIESEFFGHEKGAFTGAVSKREGRFELAHGGTILLDEISEISTTVQAKLLRVLQEREFERVGGSRTIKVDVRVIATTNRDLEQSVGKKEFRQDLFFRLNVVPVHVTPLRNRPEDVLLLKKEFMRRFSRRHGVHIKGFTNEARETLINHSWPGNVRELQNVVERAVILCGDNGMLEPQHLGLNISNQANQVAPGFATARAIPQIPGQRIGFPTLAEIEKHHILAALEHCKNNRTHAAKLLEVSIRTLRNKLHEYKNIAPKLDEARVTAGT
ncbi:MAG TPA: sigma-54 dependent transcriptional regulator [Verrucomicrobiae bacterium]|jgi:DNA-binding NtrC family response regulator